MQHAEHLLRYLRIRNNVQHHSVSVAVLYTNALTIDIVYGGRTTGHPQDSTVAAVDVLNGVATQRGVHVEGEEHSNTQQS